IIRASCFKLIRLEKVAFKSLSSMSKVAGTIICVGGPMSMALLKGQKLLNIKLVPQILVFGSGAIDSCGGEIGNEDVVYQSENDKSSFNNGEDCSGGNGGGGGIKNGRVHDSEAVNYAVPYRASIPARSRVRESPLSSDTILNSHASLFNLCIVVLVVVNSRLRI
ncbi:hypothetical protein GIB67_037953, partial [Kingdonia uniflora]